MNASYPTYPVDAGRLAACPTCDVQLLPMFSSQAPPGAESWCPVCARNFRVQPKETTKAVIDLSGVLVPTAMPVAPPQPLRPSPAAHWVCRLQADGSLSLVVAGAPPVVLSADQARAWSTAMTWLGTAADARGRALRGADRWRFMRTGPVYEVSFLEERRVLRSYTVGHTKFRPPACEACAVDLRVGELAYQPCGPHPAGRVTWAEVRLCRVCVGAATDTAEPPRGLQLIEGGKKAAR